MEKSGLIACPINIDHIISAVEINYETLNDFGKQIDENVQGRLFEYATDLEKQKRKRARIGGLFNFIGAKEYDVLEEGFFEELGNLVPKSYNETVPRELGNIEKNIGKISGFARNVKNANDIFLRYFFLTPVNRTDFERSGTETVPVTESKKIDILAFRSEETRVIPFEKSFSERGHANSESMKTIPFPLEEDSIDFLIGEILGHMQSYNAELGSLVTDLGHVVDVQERPRDNFPNPKRVYIPNDVNIANYCLKILGEKPYSALTGASAIQFGTAFSRIDDYIEQNLRSLKSKINDIEQIKHRGSSYAEQAAEKLGYKTKSVYDKYNGNWRTVRATKIAENSN